jgi:multiple sugar transport system substrate-binding protein
LKKTSTISPVRFSVAEHFLNAEKFFQALAEDFSTRTDIKAIAEAVTWDRLWNYLQEIGKQNKRMDLSEVGTTWVGHFIDKKNLHCLTDKEIARLGGNDSFLSSAWQSTMLLNDDRVFAVPWLADTRVVYYWRNDLDEIGIDEARAFITPKKMESTIAALHESGKPAWGAPTFQVNNTLHQIASWIWSNGGDFLAGDGKRTALLDSASLSGICDYYRLYRYMPCHFESLDAVLDTFEDHRTSVIVNGPWYLMRLVLGGATDELLENIGVALPPGPPFVGGSNLVIWTDAENTNEALDLIEYLTSFEVQQKICRTTGLMPVRKNVLAEEPYSTSPHYRVFSEALNLGRPLPMIAFWGPLEEALLKAFGNIWKDIKRCQDCSNIEETVLYHIEPVARRFDKLLRLV